jgi:pyruvate dehydrogenase E2 component (dihydrolipoamide acetyltransferase)
MEALSPTMTEGRVIRWLKSEGDAVKAGDTLAEVETDKAVMELVSRGEGVLRRIVASEGATIEVGKLVAVVGGAEEDISAIAGGGVAPRSGPRGSGGPEPQEVSPVRVKSAPTPVREPVKAPQATPRVAPGSPSERGPAPAAGGPERIKASPLARRMAQDRGVDLTVVSGSGPGGRIVKRDLEGATAAPLGVSRPVPATEGEFRDVPLTQIRKTIARRLAQSLAPVPHFFLTSEIDMERVWDAREALNALGENQRVSFNDILVKVVALALSRHPECNAWWQEDRIRYFTSVHLGMAVAVEDGLITPVIRDAHAKSLRDIATESRDLVERARARKLQPEEYTGATFSISNLGMFDIDQFTAIINPPEAGILAVGSITPQAVVHEGGITARRRMRVTMSCDHRVIDGATGAKLLQTVKRMLENPLAMVW